mmetsp:Transcript_18037/g.43352  ORF Transcript_18037/g.43352 Transcript_18037/m.43352 type:complete len:202 (+) Transcript_18037:1756-2361(+)
MMGAPSPPPSSSWGKARQQYPPSDSGQRAAVRRAASVGTDDAPPDPDGAAATASTARWRPARPGRGAKSSFPSTSARGMHPLDRSFHATALFSSAPLSIPPVVTPTPPLSSRASAPCGCAMTATPPPLTVFLPVLPPMPPPVPSPYVPSRCLATTTRRWSSRGSNSGPSASISSDVSRRSRIMEESSDVAGAWGEMDRKDS